MIALLATSILLGAATALCGMQLLLRLNARWLFLDRPADCHHTHRTPVPRLGGLALVLSFLVVEGFAALFSPKQTTQPPARNAVIWASLAMFALGFYDDLRPLGAKRKLFAQILIASAAWFFGIKLQWFTLPFGAGSFHLGLWGCVLTILWLVGLTNLINFIDGLDGLAGGICLMLMSLTLVISHQTGTFELLAAGMVGALGVFLRFNWPPAKIYMGDGGAYFLGFQIGALGIVNSQNGAIPAYLIALLFVLAAFILDMALTILRRGLRGLPIFRPDRKHLHHRLLAMSASPRKALLSMYGLTLPFLLMSLLVVWSHGKWTEILTVIAAFTLLIYARLLPFSRRWFDIGIASVLGNSLGMRRQILYARSLIQRFEHEGKRHETLESICGDLVVAAGKLGLCSLKVRLADSERIWEWKTDPWRARLTRDEVLRGPFGILEFKVPACPKNNGRKIPCEANKNCARHSKGCPSDPRVFAVVSELLAEGWTKAIARWNRCHAGPLSFNSSNQRAASLKNGIVSKEHLMT